MSSLHMCKLKLLELNAWNLEGEAGVKKKGSVVLLFSFRSRSVLESLHQTLG